MTALPPLTPKEFRFLAILQRELARRPDTGMTYEDIAASVGSASKANVHRYIVQLEEKGRLRRVPHRARSIEILHPVDDDAKITHDSPCPTVRLADIPDSDLVTEILRRGLLRVASDFISS